MTVPTSSSLRIVHQPPPSAIPTTSTTSTIRTPKIRFFTTSTPRANWLLPKRNPKTFKTRKGRPHIPTGGSTRGTTVLWGQYGLRLRSHDQRISAAQLKIGEDVIRRRLRGEHYRLIPRLCCNVAVYTKGNETRMGTGKGSFDHWAARVGPSRVVFELSSAAHEQVVRDAFRLAGNKLPGQWEVVRKGDPPVMGVTPLGNGVTEASLRRPRKPLPPPSSSPSPLPLESQSLIAPTTTPASKATAAAAAAMPSAEPPSTELPLASDAPAHSVDGFGVSIDCVGVDCGGGGVA